MQLKFNRFYHGDCLDFMKEAKENWAALVLTSPPYADMRNYVKIPADEYVDWFLPIAEGIFHSLKSNGVFVLNIRNNVVDKRRTHYTYKLVNDLVEEIGFDFIDDQVWDKGKGLPNTKGARPMDTHEWVYVFGKGTDVTWNPDLIRIPYDPRSLQRYEAPIKKRWGTNRGDRGDKIVTPNPLGCYPKSIIKIGSESTNVGHPAPYPVTLAEHFIKAYSNSGDVVYDPFGGSGTTAVAAQRHGRKWVCSEIHEKYIKLASERLRDVPEALF